MDCLTNWIDRIQGLPTIHEFGKAEEHNVD